MKFHTFGDSHASAEHSVWTFALEKPHAIETHHLGPVLMHSFNTNGLLSPIETFGVMGGDWVCFCFGEIDVRCHVHKYVSSTRTYKSVIDELVSGYMLMISSTTSTVADLHVAVFMVVPPYKNGTIDLNASIPVSWDE